MKIQPVHILVGVVVLIVSSLLSLAFSGKPAASSSADESRRRAIIMAAIAADAASNAATSAPKTQSPGQVMPIYFADPSVVQTRNAVQTAGVNVPQDALCRSRSDPATYAQCCNQKKSAGVLDRTCPLYNITDKPRVSYR